MWSKRWQHFAEIEAQDGALVLRSTYDASLVATLKAEIPASARRFDPASKAWIVGAAYSQQLASIVRRTLGIPLDVPAVTATNTPTTRLIRLEYLGQAKDRGDGALTAYGFDGTEWAFVFPLPVLKTWFGETSRPDEAPTLYSILGATAQVTDDELRKAYRRVARQWHPDLCSEPDATKQFQRIQAAYEVLHDPLRRARYDAGLQLQGSINRRDAQLAQQLGPAWKPPLRCGLLLVECTAQVGRLVVSRIIQWQDIVDPQGQVLVTSWPAGAKEPVRRYA
jgi:hypothetical protein